MWFQDWIAKQNDLSNSESLFGSIQLMVWEMLFEEFQDGCHGSHLGYQNGRI